MKKLILTACCLAIVLWAGCDIFPLTTPAPSDGKPPGSDLASAKPVTLDEDGNASLSGTITTDSNVHVYDLGACAAGDNIRVSVDAAAGSTLDPNIAVFDVNENVFAMNDDIDLAGGNYNSLIDEVVVEGGEHFYLGITKFYNDAAGGAYVASIKIDRGVGVPARPVQTLLLKFDGGSVTILGEGTIDCAVFDAADIDAAYAGKTAEIKAKITEVVEENYRNTGVQVVTSDDAPPAAGTFSTIYFGAYSATKFGVAESVDQGNKDCCDDGIVFTDDFDKPFATQPTVAGIATAIGNVASHEAGHLLGLNHVTDVTALMDTTGTASTLLADQEFKRAELHSSVFPFGYQDSPLILNMVVPP
jgi:hypothetical protein